MIIDINGKRVCTVQKCVIKTQADKVTILPFNSDIPIAEINKGEKHHIKLKQIKFQGGSYMSVRKLSCFDMMIYAENEHIVFTGCEWSSIEKEIVGKSNIFDEMEIIASRRIDING